MATQGPLYPGTVTTETGPSGDNDWLTETNISVDDGSEAQITAATYDAADHSFRLKGQNLSFTLPPAITIDGITVEIDRRCFAGAAQDQEVRLFDETGALVGDDKQTATAWPATLGVATYGGAADTWGWTTVTRDKLNDADFGVALIVLADAANTDIGVDYIRATVHYTPSAQTVSPAALGLALSAVAPDITQASNPAALGLSLSAVAPEVQAGVSEQDVSPSALSLTLTPVAPRADLAIQI